MRAKISKTPVKIAIITLIATQLMNLAFIIPFQHAGLALPIGLGACINAGMLYYQLRSHEIYQPQPGWMTFLVKIIAAVAVMGIVLWFATGSSASWLADSAMTRAGRLSLIIFAGTLSYFAALWLFGFRLRDFTKQQAI